MTGEEILADWGMGVAFGVALGFCRGGKCREIRGVGFGVALVGDLRAWGDLAAMGDRALVSGAGSMTDSLCFGSGWVNWRP